MADDNKKSAEEASNTFHNIMKASVSGSNVKNISDTSREEKYFKVYKSVESEMKQRGLIKETLMELCSVALDRQGNENLINFEFLLPSSLTTKTELKKSFDSQCMKYGFVVNYVNLTGDLY